MKKRSYKKLYESIWNERKKEDETGEYIIPEDDPKQRIYKNQLTVWNFSHRKCKRNFPELKYDKDNIRIVTAEFHGQKHCSGTFHNYLPL